MEVITVRQAKPGDIIEMMDRRGIEFVASGRFYQTSGEAHPTKVVAFVQYTREKFFLHPDGCCRVWDKGEFRKNIGGL